MNALFTVVVRNNRAELSELFRKVDLFLQGREMSSRAAYVVALVVEEILTNITKYAFSDEAEHEIGVGIHLGEENVRIEIKDDGREFNPLLAPAPDLNKPMDELEPGGMGLHLVRKMSNSMEYRRVGAVNVLLILVNRFQT